MTTNHLDVFGKTVLITGAGQGIGAALAKRLDMRGAHLALVDVDPEIPSLAQERFGSGAIGITADVRDRVGMRAAVDAAVAEFGGLDVVVANAGVTPTPATLRQISDDEFDRVIDINLMGAYNTVRPALDHIVTNKGHVVVVASVAAFSPGAGGAPYMISKAGVAQLGRALRIELAPHGATAGVAYFGVVDTNMTHAAFDESDLGREINNLLPWPLNRRISPEAAGETIARGILERAPETCAPAGWQQFKWLHGILNPILDRRLVSDSHLHRLLGRFESTLQQR